MSYQTWHIYGYGICVSDIDCDSVEKLQALIHMAPKFEKAVNEWLSSNEIESPSWEDYMEYDEDYCLGLATFLKEVILECEGIELTACDDFDGYKYLLLEPAYPWSIDEQYLKEITKERIEEIYGRYVSILTDQEILVDYYSPENGG